MDRSVIIEVPSASGQRRTGLETWEFTWGLIRRGDRTMLEGAKWTLLPNGAATFESTVTSGDDNGAWVIWHVDLLDANGSILGSLTNDNPVPGGDYRKFVQTMPNSGETYRFRAWAHFDAGLWNDIARLKMHSSC